MEFPFCRPVLHKVDELYRIRNIALGVPLLWYDIFEMGFRNSRALLIDALMKGNFQHEPRDVLSEKNLLAVGDVDVEFVVKLLKKAGGHDYRSSPHDSARSIPVHVFKPLHEGERWYIKAYFLDDGSEIAVFISVHK